MPQCLICLIMAEVSAKYFSYSRRLHMTAGPTPNWPSTRVIPHFLGLLLSTLMKYRVSLLLCEGFCIDLMLRLLQINSAVVCSPAINVSIHRGGVENSKLRKIANINNFTFHRRPSVTFAGPSLFGKIWAFSQFYSSRWNCLNL